MRSTTSTAWAFACVCVGYALYVLLSWATDELLKPALTENSFSFADICAQFVYTSLGAFVAAMLSRDTKRVSIWMSAIGLCLGAVSVILTWQDGSPRWYHVLLYLTYVPAVLAGTSLARLRLKGSRQKTGRVEM